MIVLTQRDIFESVKISKFIHFIFVASLCGPHTHAMDLVVKNGNKESARPGEIISVNKNDVKILKRAAQILISKSSWNRHDNRECPPSASTYSLYCAMWKASVEVNGEFDHRLGALEELRRTVENVTKGRTYKHRLMDYNNDPSTKLNDIQNILSQTAERISKRLTE